MYSYLLVVECCLLYLLLHTVLPLSTDQFMEYLSSQFLSTERMTFFPVDGNCLSDR